MDINNIIAVVGTFIVSIGAVAAIIAKFLPKIVKYVHVAKDALDVAETAIEALQDNEITKDEIDNLMAKVANLKIALKS